MKRDRARGPWIKLRDGSRHHLWELRLREILINRGLLKERGVYERAVLCAFIRTNHRECSLGMLRQLFVWCDLEALRKAGDPLPGPGPFTLYRGVAGSTQARRVRGISWTALLEQARWFAGRAGKHFGLADPGVYRVMVPESRVLAYSNAEQEEEFIVLLEPKDRVERIE